MKEDLKKMNEINYEAILKTAKDKFGIESIFPYQLLVIFNILDACSKEEAELEKENTRQIVLFPTGAGKSLCFQLPSLFLEKPTLVIYPLLALMRDQYNKLKDILNTVIFIGGQTSKEREEAYQNLQTAHIIIANPEILSNKEVLYHIKKRGISHLAIDEAHCVSEWGTSFRPSYLNISSIIGELKPTVVTAFTATASEVVLQKMQGLIFAHKAHIIQSALDRPNIFFASKYCVVKERALLQEIEKSEKPIVVFCSSRKKCEQLARIISIEIAEIQTKFYHAGLKKSEKLEIEEWFYKAKNACLVATCAYGMGVDKKDIRTVIHFEAPLTIEAYIQEAGRGGRDRKNCSAILLWNDEDEKRILKLENEQKTRYEVMMSFAKSNSCKRHFLLKALSLSQDEKDMPVCENCDVCTKDASNVKSEIEIACNYIKMRKIKKDELIEAIANMGEYWNLQYSKKLISYMEEKNIIIKDWLFWRGKLKLNKRHL